MERQLEIGATYRHWKASRLYKVLGEVEIKNKFRDGMTLRLEPYGFVIASTPLTSEDIAVIYEDEAGHKFAREKSSFLEVLEGGKYRFEVIDCPTLP